MDKETLGLLTMAANVLRLCSSSCQEWQTLPTLEQLNNINKLMRANMSLVYKVLATRIDKEMQQ